LDFLAELLPKNRRVRTNGISASEDGDDFGDLDKFVDSATLSGGGGPKQFLAALAAAIILDERQFFCDVRYP